MTGDDDDDDSEDGWVNPCEGMSQDEQDDLDLSMRPVRLVLVKVSLNSDQQILMSDICTSYKNLPLQSKLYNYTTSSLVPDSARFLGQY